MRADVCARIEGLSAELDRSGVESLALVNSVARDRLSPTSYIDVLVRFRGPVRFDAFIDVKFALRDALRRPVELGDTGGT